MSIEMCTNLHNNELLAGWRLPASAITKARLSSEGEAGGKATWVASFFICKMFFFTFLYAI